MGKNERLGGKGYVNKARGELETGPALEEPILEELELLDEVEETEIFPGGDKLGDELVNDGVELYFKEIREKVLLTPEKEREYAQTVERGKVARQLRAACIARSSKIEIEASEYVMQELLNTLKVTEYISLTITERKKATKKQGRNAPSESNNEEVYPKKIKEPLSATVSEINVKDIKNFRNSLNDPDKQAKLIEIEQLADKASRVLIEHNLRLVVFIAKKIQFTGRGMGLLDRIQEGSIGLMHAVEKFNWWEDYKFSTYASIWIAQAIRRGLENKGRAIRVPIYIYEVMDRIKIASGGSLQDLEREATPEEIAAKTGISLEQVHDIDNIDKVTGNVLSLETTVYPDSDETIGDSIPDSTLGTEALSLQTILQGEVRKVLRLLPDREREVLELRFGIGDNIPRTLEEIGRLKGLSRELIRRIEATAMAKLRIFALEEKLVEPTQQRQAMAKSLKKGAKSFNQ